MGSRLQDKRQEEFLVSKEQPTQSYKKKKKKFVAEESGSYFRGPQKERMETFKSEVAGVICISTD